MASAVDDTADGPDATPGRSPNRLYATEIFLGSVVAILTILTAVAAFQASRLSVDAGRASGRSVRTLQDSLGRNIDDPDAYPFDAEYDDY